MSSSSRQHPIIRRIASAAMAVLMAANPLLVSAQSAAQYRIPVKLAASEGLSLEFAPDPVNFEDVAVGQVRTLEARLRNTGTSDASGITMTARYPFSVDSAQCRHVPAGGDCPVWVSFAPGTGGPVADTMAIRAGDAVLDPVLLGNGVPLIANLEISDGGGWNYGAHALGTASPTKTLTLRNTGTGPLLLDSVAPLKGSHEYKLVHDCPAELAAGSTCSVTVHFEPEVLGQRLGAFRVKAQDGSVRDVWLLGYGVLEGQTSEMPLGTLTVVPQVPFGGLTLPAAERVQSISISNTGSTPVDLSSLTLAGADAAAFSLNSECPAQLAPFSACAVHLGFQPSEIRTYSSAVTFTGAVHALPVDGQPAVVQAPVSYSIELTGAGTEVPTELVATPEAVDFGETSLNTPVQRSLTLTNHSDQAQSLRISYATNAENFVVLGGCSGTIGAGQSCELNLLYQAATANRSDGELILVSRETNQTLAIPLTGAAPVPDVRVAQASVVFGTVDVQAVSPPKTVRLVNDGLAPAQLLSATVLNASADFLVDADTCDGVIPAQGQCEVALRFSPQVSGARQGSLRLQTTNPATPVFNVALSGTGQVGALFLNPTSLYFGLQDLTTTTTQTVAVSNQGPGTVRVADVAVSGAGQAGYAVTHTCTQLLAVGQSCEVQVAFTPLDARAYDATLTLETGQGLGSSVSLSGWGRAPLAGVLALSPNPVDFGDVSIHHLPATRQVQLRNSGTDVLVVESLTLTGPEALAFTHDTACVKPLAVGERCNVTLSGNIAQLARYEAQLNVQVQGQALRSVPVRAHGVELDSDARLAVTPELVDLGPILPGVPVPVTLTLQSQGLAAVTLLAPSPLDGVTLLNSCTGDIAPGAQCTLQLQVTVGSQDLNAVLELRTAQGQRVPVPISAQRLAGKVQLSPGALEFGTVSLGERSAEQALWVTNTGNASVSLDAVALTGADSAHYALSHACPASLAAGQRCALTLAMVPLADGPLQAHVRVDTSAGAALASLQGQGLNDANWAPDLEVSPSALAFPTTAVGRLSATQTLTLTNVGQAMLALDAIGTSLPDVFTQSNNCGAALAPAQSCEVAVRFAPQAVQAYAQSVLILASQLANSPVAVPVSGQGWEPVVPVPALRFSPTSLDFGRGPVGDTRVLSAQLMNTADQDQRVPAFSFKGNAASAYRLQTSTCTTVLAAGQSCTLAIAFEANHDGAHPAALTGVMDSGAPVSLSLAGQGPEALPAPVAELVLEPSALSFGTLAPDTLSAARTVSVRNLSDTISAQVPMFSLTGTDAPAFALDASACGASLDPGASCALSLTYQAGAAAQTHRAVLEGVSPAGTALATTLVGTTGAPDLPQFTLQVQPENVEFGRSDLGVALSATVTVQNLGPDTAPLPVWRVTGQHAWAFAVDASACGPTLSANTSCPLSVRFTPGQGGLHQASLEALTLHGEALRVSLSGLGPTALAQLTPAQLDFGVQPLGFTSAAQPVTLTNIGQVPLAVSGRRIDSPIFLQEGACPATLAPGAACTWNIKARPHLAQESLATLTVDSAHEEGPLQVSLRVQGQATTASVVPSMLDLGVVYATQPVTRSVQVTNTGGTELFVKNVSFDSAPGNQGYSQTNTCANGVPAGSSCDVVVRLAPTRTGELANTLRIDTAAGLFEVPIVATGARLRLTSVAPDRVPASGGALVGVFGAGFTQDTVVLIDGQAAPTTWVSATELQVTTPAHPAGVVDVAVAQEGAQTEVLAGSLEYVDAPTLTSLAPDTGSIAGGWSTTLSGSGFVAGTVVTIEGQPATVLTRTEAQVSVRVPARTQVLAGPVDVVVTTVGGSVTLPGALTYSVPPANLVFEGDSGAMGDISQFAFYERTVTLRNAGDSAVQLTNLFLADNAGGVFARNGGTCPDVFPTTFARGARCTITLVAHSTVLGAASATLTAVTNPPAGTFTLPLSASVFEPDYSLSGTPGAMTLASGRFGVLPALNEHAGTNGTLTRTIYLNNSFGVPGTQIHDIEVSITGREAEVFSIQAVQAASGAGALRASGAVISANGHLATGAVVDDGDGAYPHLAVTLRFAPPTKGDFNTQLSIAFNGDRVVGLPLHGEALYVNEATLQGEGDFGVTGFSTNLAAVQRTAHTFTVSSDPAVGKPLAVSAIRIQGVDAANFEVTAYSKHQAGEPLNVSSVYPSAMVQSASLEDLTFTVRFTPSRLGEHTAQLVVDSNTDGLPLVMDLTGVGAREVAVELSAGSGITPLTDYPMTGIGAQVIKDVFLRNTGTSGAVTFSGMQIVGSPAFTIVGYGRADGVSKTSVATPPASARYMTTPVVGADVGLGGVTDFYASLRFNPTYVGTHEALVTIWHDAPGESTTFTVRGEAVRAAAALSSSTTLPVVTPNGDFGLAAFNGAGHASNQVVSQTLNVLNATGIGQLQVTRLRITGEHAGAFSVTNWPGKTAGDVAGQDVYPTNMRQSTSTQALPFTLAFTPTHLGSHSAQLVVEHDGMNSQPLTLALTGFGDRDVVFALSQGAGIAPIGPINGTALNTPVTRTIYLRNVGTAGLARYTGFTLQGSDVFTVKAVGLVSRNATSFTPRVNYNTPVRDDSFSLEGADARLAPNALTDLAITVQMTPSTRDTFSATLTLLHDGPDGQTVVDLVGGYYAPALTFYAADDLESPIEGVDFGPQAVGQASEPYAVVLQNSGNVPLTLSAAQLALPAPFTLDERSICAGIELVPEAQCTLNLVFTPTQEQAYSSTKSFVDAIQGLAATTFALQGQGTRARFEFWSKDGTRRITELTFPHTEVGQSRQMSFQLKSIGTGGLELDEEAPFTVDEPFAVVSSTCEGRVIAPNIFCDVVLEFAPDAGGRFDDGSWKLEVVSTAATAPVLTIKGRTPPALIVEVVTGGNHTFARKADGTWWATGNNSSGQLGLGDTTHRTSFTQVSALTGATDVVAGGNHTFARKADGTWWATGYNGQGQLGLGNTTSRRSFTQVLALEGVTEVVAGGGYTFACKADGTWWATGNNSSGQLGLGDTTNRTSFKQIPMLTGAIEVVVGNYHTFARKADGTWWATGNNAQGQLGLGDTIRRLIFTLVSTLTGATKVVAGGYHTFARKSDGTWWAAGRNLEGQLGLGNTTNRTSFTQVSVLTGATDVVTGEYHAFARKLDGTWRATGQNNYGQLGLEGAARRSSFTLVPALEGANSVVSGMYHIFARKPDGTWWVTGYNNIGQLGLGNGANQMSFSPIPEEE